MMGKQELIYGFDARHQVIDYWKLYEDEICTRNERVVVERMMKDESVIRVYKIDNRYKLYEDYMRTRTSDHAEWYMFEDICKNEGLLIGERR